MTQLGLLVLVIVSSYLAIPAIAAQADDSLSRISQSPRTVAEVWAGYDPRIEALDMAIVREWKEDGIVFRYVTFTIGTFRGRKATMAGFYGFREGQTGLPALLHMHGGGQRAFLREVRRFANRGYAVLSVNWGGRPMERSNSTDPNTDWGAVDPTQNNVAGYSTLLPGPNTIDSIPSARNNNWFLLTLGCRRGITFLENQAEVDGERIGVYGHSMGGRLTGLVAGTDRRVKVAAPSVGGSGFLQDDFWGVPGSGRRVRGNLKLFQETIAGHAYLPLIRCPLLFLSATNDFNAPMDFVEKGMGLVPHDNKRTVYAVHLNHRFSPESEITRPLWLDAHLRTRFQFPETPRIKLILSNEDRIPRLEVVADQPGEIESVEIYYGYGRDPRNRFWMNAGAKKTNNQWLAECPVFDLDEPLFCLANVRYRLNGNRRNVGDPASFILSATATAFPGELKSAGVVASEKSRLVIDDFSRGFRDWYILQGNNPHHWFFATRKLADPRWEATATARLAFQVETTAKKNTLAVQLRTNQWRGYANKKFETWTAMVPLSKKGRQEVELDLTSFRNGENKMLTDWEGITELIFRAGDKVEQPLAKDLPQWSGDRPKFFQLRWKLRTE